MVTFITFDITNHTAHISRMETHRCMVGTILHASFHSKCCISSDRTDDTASEIINRTEDVRIGHHTVVFAAGDRRAIRNTTDDTAKVRTRIKEFPCIAAAIDRAVVISQTNDTTHIRTFCPHITAVMAAIHCTMVRDIADDTTCTSISAIGNDRSCIPTISDRRIHMDLSYNTTAIATCSGNSPRTPTTGDR